MGGAGASAEYTLEIIRQLLAAAPSFVRAVKYADGPNLDAVARLRVSEPLTIFDSKQIFDSQPLFWDEELETGAGIATVHSSDTASSVFTSTISTAGKYTRQTFMRFNYQPGKGQQILMTGIIQRSGGGAGVQRRIGLFDDDNGLFFEDNAGTMRVIRRTSVTGSPVDDHVDQADWNLDKMDGNGPSGRTVDWSKTHIFVIDFEWLGVGRIRYGVFIDGRIDYVHEFLVANTLDKVHMSTPNLPLRIQMITTGSSPVATMEAICASVISEGGREDLGVLQYITTGGDEVALTNQDVIYAIVAIRLKSTHLGAQVDLITASLLEFAGSKNAEWLLIFNGSIAGSPTWLNKDNSALQFFLGVTANVVTGGDIIGGEMFVSAGGAPTKAGALAAQLKNARRLGAKIDGTPDTIVLAVRPLAGSSALTVEGSLTVRETP